MFSPSKKRRASGLRTSVVSVLFGLAPHQMSNVSQGQGIDQPVVKIIVAVAVGLLFAAKPIWNFVVKLFSKGKGVGPPLIL